MAMNLFASLVRQFQLLLSFKKNQLLLLFAASCIICDHTKKKRKKKKRREIARVFYQLSRNYRAVVVALVVYFA